MVTDEEFANKKNQQDWTIVQYVTFHTVTKASDN